MPEIEETNISGIAITRRDVMAKGGALAAASVAMTCVSGTAFAMTGDEQGISTIRAPFAIHGGSIVHGFIAIPNVSGQMNVLVVLGENGRSDDAARAAARHYAHAGFLAMAPDLHATFGGDGLSDTAALRTRMEALKPMLARLPRSNGNVQFVTA